MKRLLVAVVACLACLAHAGCDTLHARMLAQEGVTAYREAKIAVAADKFERAVKLDPNIPTIQLNLGFANLALYQQAPRSKEGGDAAGKAIVAFENYLQMRPTEERARVFLIQTFIDTGRYDDAVTYFRAAVDKTPPDGEALTTLGIIASKTGRYEDAKNWYERRITLEPQNAEARLKLGALLWDYLHSHIEVAGADRVALADVAIGHLAEAIKVKPNAPDPELYMNLVYRERALGQPDEDKKNADIDQAHKHYARMQELKQDKSKHEDKK